MRQQTEPVEIFPDRAALAAGAARHFVRIAREAVARQGLSTVALAGGTTPADLYRLLATDSELRAAMPWAQTQFFFGDERHVPPDDPASNFRMAQETLFTRLAPDATHVHRFRAENADAAAAAAEYEAVMRQVFTDSGQLANGWPQFDLVLLGLGPDGHTASLFPDSAALEERERWAVADWVEKFGAYRLTLTVPVFNHARAVLLLVAGEDKAPIVAAVLGHPEAVPRFPVQLIQPATAPKRWLLDQAAAAQLPR